jgi:hypothetical protein
VPGNPYAPEPRDADAIRAWLNGEPETPTFAQMWDDLTRLIIQGGSFTRLDTRDAFEVSFDAGEQRITISHAAGQLVVSESLLSETWHHARAAGYVLPPDLPGGEDAPYIIGLLSELPYFRPVLWSHADEPEQRQIGLQYVSPVSKGAG